MATRFVLAELAAQAGLSESGVPGGVAGPGAPGGVAAEAAGSARADGSARAGSLDIESVGGVDAERRVAGGEAFDLVFLAQGALGRLAAGGHVLADTVTPLVLSQTAAAVPAGPGDPATAELPEGVAFADADEMRAALLRAARIGYSTGPSGTALVQMIDEWGFADELGERLVQARPGVPVARSLAEGEVDLGFQQLSELAGQPGIRILGVLPKDCAIDTVFGGAVAAASADPAAARAVLSRFASPEVAQIKAAHAFALPPA
ncbi:MAG: substrate-binding domain-containing protein [Leucobacter sp.]|nr:substrate-binding domain-containing protein [Leucobacter sp.]